MAYFKCNHGYDRIFGNGSLGNVHIDADTNLSTMFPSFVEDKGVFELNCINFNLDSGKTLTANMRNAGVVIRCLGDCTINGNITNRLAPRSIVDADGNDIAVATLSPYYPAWMIDNGGGGKGGNGGTNRYQGTYMSDYLYVYGGSGQLGRFYGGGYSGGGAGGCGWEFSYRGTTSHGGNGGSATGINTNTGMFYGGGAISISGYWGSDGVRVAGNPGSLGGGGGAGNGDSWGEAREHWIGAGAGGSGAGGWGQILGNSGGGGAGNVGGGVVIVYCAGNLIVDGTINCNGSNGGGGAESSRGWGPDGNGGGGAGGGRIYLLGKKNIDISSITTSVLGGTAGSNGGDATGVYVQPENGGNGDRWYTTYADYKSGNAPTAIAS